MKTPGSLVKRKIQAGAAAGALLHIWSAFTAQAALTQATVTEKVNIVTVRESAAANARPISEGATVQGENIVRTGINSRAALQFNDQSLARLGSNTVFSFDAAERNIEFEQGSALFSKPKNRERLEIRTAAVTAAITGSTAFVSVSTPKSSSASDSGCPPETVLLGMLEGKTKGTVRWCNPATGREESVKFTIGAGQMLVREPGKRPVVVTFDLPRFVSTSPLITKFDSPLPNQSYIDRELVSYNRLLDRGFIKPTDVMLANLDSGLAIGRPASGQSSFDGGIQQIARLSRVPTDMSGPASMPQIPRELTHSGSGSGAFENVGGSAVIRGQLIWTNAADLDLHLILPDLQEVSFANKTVVFNNGQATAQLDADNLGGTVNVAPDKRVENIIVTGNPQPGNYQFFFRNFSGTNGPDTGKLTISGDNGQTTQTLTSTPANGSDSPKLILTVP